MTAINQIDNQNIEQLAMDHLAPSQRSQLMSRIKGRDTSPEKRLRSLLHKAGFRFRLYIKNLPGKPDIVLPKYTTVIFVHGCFWHGHTCNKGTTRPKTRAEFWEKKISGNMDRDRRNFDDLINLGWKVVTVWECELKKSEELIHKLVDQFNNL